MADLLSTRTLFMDALKQVTPLVITHNEEANICRTLAGLRWARRIVVVDSGSTDATLELLDQSPQVEVVHRSFDSFADQCNFGLGLVRTPWCLSLDADHLITPAFLAELAKLLATAPADLAAVITPFRYLVAGKPLRGTLLPPRVNLMRPGCGHYENDGHSHQFVPSGRTATMREPVLHDDRKPLSRWFASQQRYLQQEANKLCNTPWHELGFNDALRRTYVISPFAVLALCLIWHRGLLDGWRGWFYAFQRMYVETQLSLMLWDKRRTDKLGR